MSSVRVTFWDGEAREFPWGSSWHDLLAQHGHTPQDTLAVRAGHQLAGLWERVEVDNSVAPVTTDTREGRSVYRHSLCFLLALASSRLFPRRRLQIGHSLGNGFFFSYEVVEPLPAEQIAALRQEMRRIVEQNLDIRCRWMDHAGAVRHFTDHHQPGTVLLLQHLNRASYRVHVCGEYIDLYHGALAPRTGMLGAFDLLDYPPGFLLRYPPREDPRQLVPFQDSPLLFSIYREYKQWGKILQVSSVGELNELIASRRIHEFIQVAEALHDKKIAQIADRIAAGRQKIGLVLIAGPSSSGKTTFSKKLSIQLRVVGRNPVAISLDDYFVSRDRTPRDSSGAFDYEALEAVDVELLNQHLLDLFEGREVHTPQYDFRTGTRSAKSRAQKLPERAVLILEGIHGLNERLTPLIPRERKHLIYVSALTQLNLDDHNRISTTDNRLIRRTVRDYQYRGHSPATTLGMWESVLRGEDRNIFPYQNSADSAFNSALDYELAVLKVYAEPLLRMVRPDEEQYTEARRLLEFLENIGSIPSHYVPESSILREFIGGSVFKY